MAFTWSNASMNNQQRRSRPRVSMFSWSLALPSLVLPLLRTALWSMSKVFIYSFGVQLIVMLKVSSSKCSISRCWIMVINEGYLKAISVCYYFSCSIASSSCSLLPPRSSPMFEMNYSTHSLASITASGWGMTNCWFIEFMTLNYY